MSRLGQISRVKHVLDKDALTIVVNCLVFSKLFYCSNVWSNTTESNLDKVQKVQNFACRIVSGVKKCDHITQLLRTMQWLPIREQLYNRNALMAFNSLFSHDVTRYPYLGVRHYGAPRQLNLMQISSHFYSSSQESRNTLFHHGYSTGKLQ